MKIQTIALILLLLAGLSVNAYLRHTDKQVDVVSVVADGRF